MNSHINTIHGKLLAHPVRSDIEWQEFTAYWRATAQDVELEHGDRLVVHVGGRREVFHRPRDKRVPTADVNRAKQLIVGWRSAASTKPGEKIFIVALNQEQAKLLSFETNRPGHCRQIEHVDNNDHRARRLRADQKRSGKHTQVSLDSYFEVLATALHANCERHSVILLGHGAGMSNVALQFEHWLAARRPEVASWIVATGTADVTTATNSELEASAWNVAVNGPHKSRTIS